jgi:hypothetical protein
MRLLERAHLSMHVRVLDWVGHRCDGEGRVLGGLAALPGFGWWPIKAYKPCGGLSSAGIDYVR